MTLNRLFFGTIIVSLILSAFVGLRYATSEGARQEETVVRFIPSSATVGCGEVFTVALVIENVEDLVAFDVKFKWNTTAMQYINHTLTVPVEDYPAPNPPSPYTGIIVDNGNLFFIKEPAVDDPLLGPGTFWVALTQIPTPAYVGFNGNGTIGVFTFKALNEPGLAYLEFLAEPNLGNSAVEPIPCDFISGAVTIRGLVISFISPENRTYSTPNVSLTFTVDDPPAWVGYSLDGAANVTIAGNATLVGLSEGPHHVVVRANSSDGRVGWKTRFFSVDTIPPVISMLSPENRTYPSDTVTVVFTVIEPIVWSGLSVDGSPIATSGNTTLSNLSDGPHWVQVHANDTVGNQGSSGKVYFTVDTTPPTVEAVDWVGLSPYPYVPSLIIRAGEPVLVTAAITDASGVTRTTICQRVDNGIWWNGTMTHNDTAEVWTCTLPGQLGGQVVEFFITAYDPFGHAAATPLYVFDTCALLVGDVDGDGDVDIFDIVRAASNYGKTLP